MNKASKTKTIELESMNQSYLNTFGGPGPSWLMGPSRGAKIIGSKGGL